VLLAWLLVTCYPERGDEPERVGDGLGVMRGSFTFSPWGFWLVEGVPVDVLGALASEIDSVAFGILGG
jgi:hypothetical protein